MMQMARAQSIPVLFIYIISYLTVKLDSRVVRIILVKETTWPQPMLPNVNPLCLVSSLRPFQHGWPYQEYKTPDIA